MKVTFYSNYLSHHQLPFCLEMEKRLGNDFKFVATKKMREERKKIGYSELDNKYPFVIKEYENENNKIIAMNLALESDVVIIGFAPEIYISERFKKTNKLTFRYSERIYRRGLWRAYSPKSLLNAFNTYHRYKNKPLYLLCAGAYTAGDYSKVGAYIDKCYKWGYFPEFKRYDIDELMKRKDNATTNILWVGRYLKLKHPELTIEVAKRLKEERYNFKLTFIGSGELENEIKGLVNNYGLNEYVDFFGGMDPSQVREHMEKANIFIFNSDFNEGWGAVINEAMNSACAVVSSHASGAAPYLIKDGENGFIYKNPDIDDLYYNVKKLMDSKKLQEEIGKNAYLTILNEWNAETATERLLELFESKLMNKDFNVESGPCSKALAIKQNKMYSIIKNTGKI